MSHYSYTPIDIAAIEFTGTALLDAHYDEVAKNKRLMVLRPDWDKYYQLEHEGKILAVGAFLDNKLVGYSVNFVDYHIHYADLMVCSNDIIYITPELRASPLGLRLMVVTRELAKEYGAKLMLWHAKEHSALDKILRRRKAAKVQDIVFSEEL